MARIKIVFYHYKKYKDGSSPLMLRLTKGKSMRYFKIGDNKFNITSKQWNQEYGLVKADKRVNPEHELIVSVRGTTSFLIKIFYYFWPGISLCS
jgi:hypothetical protein